MERGSKVVLVLRDHPNITSSYFWTFLDPPTFFHTHLKYDISIPTHRKQILRKKLPHKRLEKNPKKVHFNFFLTYLHVSKSQWFFPIWILIFMIYYIWETSRNKLKKHSVTKNCSDLSLFEQIVLLISNFLQILGLQPRISKVFLDH